jgi:hypothetical protein
VTNGSFGERMKLLAGFRVEYDGMPAATPNKQADGVHRPISLAGTPVSVPGRSVAACAHPA